MKIAVRMLASAAAFIAVVPFATAQDAEKGATVFRQKCFQCHRVGAGAKNLIGPQLNGVVGRAATSVQGFNYSPIQRKKKAEGLVWTPENLDKYLESPRKFMPGTRMAFVGLPKPDDRQNIIAYLKTFNEKGEKVAGK
ncbi:MAG: hypothetical protein RLZ98_3491 [Pseudomonadota bacterium]|jgi:cytochrome c